MIKAAAGFTAWEVKVGRLWLCLNRPRYWASYGIGAFEWDTGEDQYEED